MTKETPEQDIHVTAKSITTKLKTIAKVSIDNIGDVSSHVILNENGLTVHKVVYKNGGQFRISYTSAGKLMECIAKKVTVAITDDTQITLIKQD